MPLNWQVDECAAYFDRLYLRGWCHHAPEKIVRVEALFTEHGIVVPLKNFALPSPDVAASFQPSATHCRFAEFIDVPAEALGRDFALCFTLEDGGVVLGESVITKAAKNDPYFLCWDHFVDRLEQFKEGTVLEIGSRARSAMTRLEMIPKQLKYVGLDILPGPNVDVVGDAHELEKLFGRDRFVAAFSLSVFEHLAMPWKVALELNRVLAPGGIVFTSTHQTWPVHEEPWDFWRFSRYSWQTLFNPATGFEVLEAASGEPARIHPRRTTPAMRTMHQANAYLGSASIVRKVSETTLSWPVPLSVAARDMYPKGELAEPPK